MSKNLTPAERARRGPSRAFGSLAPAKSVRWTDDQIEKKVKELKERGGTVMFNKFTKGGLSITGYTENNGNRVVFEDRVAPNGTVKLKHTVALTSGQAAGKVEFSERALPVDSQQEDLIRALLRHPECRNSPNRKGMTTFGLHDPEGDAAQKLQEERDMNQAKNLAFDIKGYELALAAMALGETRRQDMYQTQALVDTANTDPYKILGMLTRKGSKVLMKEEAVSQALVGIAMREGVIARPERDKPYMFNEVQVGATEADVINRITNDKALRDSLDTNVKQIIES